MVRRVNGVVERHTCDQNCRNILYLPELGSSGNRLKSRKGGLNIASPEKAGLSGAVQAMPVKIMHPWLKVDSLNSSCGAIPATVANYCCNATPVLGRGLTSLPSQPTGPGHPRSKRTEQRTEDLKVQHLNDDGNTGSPKQAKTPAWRRSYNSTQCLVVMTMAAGIQPGLSGGHKRAVMRVKAQREKGEVEQLYRTAIESVMDGEYAFR